MNLPRREHRIELPGAGRTHRPRPLLSAHLTETLARPTMAGSAGSRPAGGKPLQQTALPAPQSRPRLPGPGPPGSFRAVAAAERPGQRGSRALRPAHLQAGSGGLKGGGLLAFPAASRPASTPESPALPSPCWPREDLHCSSSNLHSASGTRIGPPGRPPAQDILVSLCVMRKSSDRASHTSLPLQLLQPAVPLNKSALTTPSQKLEGSDVLQAKLLWVLTALPLARSQPPPGLALPCISWDPSHPQRPCDLPTEACSLGRLPRSHRA